MVRSGKIYDEILQRWQIGRALFGKHFPNKLELTRLQRVFPAMTELTLNELDIRSMQLNRKQLVGAFEADIGNTNLKRVVLQSAVLDLIQESLVLNDCVVRFKRRFKTLGWDLEYNFKRERTHIIEMTKRIQSTESNEKRLRADRGAVGDNGDGRSSLTVPSADLWQEEKQQLLSEIAHLKKVQSEEKQQFMTAIGDHSLIT